jgi:hypothetical protein
MCRREMIDFAGERLDRRCRRENKQCRCEREDRMCRRERLGSVKRDVLG